MGLLGLVECELSVENCRLKPNENCVLLIYLLCCYKRRYPLFALTCAGAAEKISGLFIKNGELISLEKLIDCRSSQVNLKLKLAVLVDLNQSLRDIQNAVRLLCLIDIVIDKPQV